MAGRRDQRNKATLSRAELEAFRREVEGWSRQELETRYKTYHNACGYGDMRVCSPRDVQEFVQIWKRLYKLKGGRMVWE